MTDFLPVTNGAGLRMELNRDGGVRRIWFGEQVVNLFMGNGMEPGPANLWLRQPNCPLPRRSN